MLGFVPLPNLRKLFVLIYQTHVMYIWFYKKLGLIRKKGRYQIGYLPVSVCEVVVICRQTSTA